MFELLHSKPEPDKDIFGDRYPHLVKELREAARVAPLSAIVQMIAYQMSSVDDFRSDAYRIEACAKEGEPLPVHLWDRNLTHPSDRTQYLYLAKEVAAEELDRRFPVRTGA